MEFDNIKLIERIRDLHAELRSELLDDIVTVHVNEYHLKIPVHKRFEIQQDIESGEDVNPSRDFFYDDEVLDYGQHYLTISLERTQIIDTRIRDICNKHGFDFGTMLIIKDSPRFHQQLRNKLLIVLTDINNSSE